MKSSIFSPYNTSGQPGGSLILDRILSAVKKALDVLANGQVSNVTEAGGVWLVTPGPLPTGNPPTGEYFAGLDPVDGKWKTRGSNGTITVIGVP